MTMQTLSPLGSTWSQAQSFYSEGNLRAALTLCETILSSRPHHSGAHLLLAHIASRGDKRQLVTTHALAAASRLERQPLEHIVSVTRMLFSVGEYETAFMLIGNVDPASVSSPPNLLAELARLLGLLERHEEALKFVDTAIRRGMKSASVSYFRGNCLKFLGRFDQASAAFEDSLQIDPDFGQAHVAIADLGQPANAARNIDRITKAIRTARADRSKLPHLFFALFKELDRIGDTEAAWQALESGCREKSLVVQHDAVEETALFSLLIDACGREFRNPSMVGNSPRTPIFIVGLPRSGTTLLEHILGNHPGITQCGELNDFRMQHRWATDHACAGALDRTTIARMAAVDYSELGQRYLDHTAWRSPDTAFFTDKKPGNFMMIGMILRAIPHARIIHIKRDPMDSCFSNLKELFGASAHTYSYGFTDMASHFHNYARLMAHWHEIAPNRILDVAYEDLVTEPERASRRVMSYCGLPYEDGQIRVEENATPVSTASSIQVRSPITTRGLGGWKRYARQLEPLRQLIETGAGH